jgi:hypothetical protein
MLSNFLAINQGLPFDTHQKKRKEKKKEVQPIWASFHVYVCQRGRKRIRVTFGWSRSNLVGFGWLRSNLVTLRWHLLDVVLC